MFTKYITDNKLRLDNVIVPEVELLTDIDMIVKFMGAKRGGCCNTTVRYAEASESKEDDEKKELLYFDANNVIILLYIYLNLFFFNKNQKN